MWKSFAALVWVLLGGIPQCSRMYWMKNFIRASSWSDPASRACYGSFPNLDDLLRRPGEPWVQSWLQAQEQDSATGRSLAQCREGLVTPLLQGQKLEAGEVAPGHKSEALQTGQARAKVVCEVDCHFRIPQRPSDYAQHFLCPNGC